MLTMMMRGPSATSITAPSPIIIGMNCVLCKYVVDDALSCIDQVYVHTLGQSLSHFLVYQGVSGIEKGNEWRAVKK